RCSGAHQRGALRPGPGPDPGRGQLARAGLHRRGRDAVLRRPGAGGLRVGRGGQALPRLRAVVGGVDPGPRPPARHRCRAPGGGSGLATLGLPDSAGVPRAAVCDTLVVPYNRVPELGPDVACVVVEPIAANMGLVPPVAGFLEGLRLACDDAGALLVFDEVIT